MRNEGGLTLLSFCKWKKLYITHTWYEQKKSARHTWTDIDST